MLDNFYCAYDSGQKYISPEGYTVDVYIYTARVIDSGERLKVGEMHVFTSLDQENWIHRTEKTELHGVRGLIGTFPASVRLNQESIEALLRAA